MARPRIISSPDEAWERGQAFFKERRSQDRPLTVTGLALALGLNSRQALLDYENRPEFIDTIKALKSECEEYAEERIFGGNAAGAIFALKNYGWTDKQEIDQKVDGNHVYTWLQS
jgi:hypothetical protein